MLLISKLLIYVYSVGYAMANGKRVKKVMIGMPPALLHDLDTIIAGVYARRSDAINEAIRDFIVKKKEEAARGLEQPRTPTQVTEEGGMSNE
jgi:metal-responsive CopG/Arc/MetJ family transcriptional regulator